VRFVLCSPIEQVTPDTGRPSSFCLSHVSRRAGGMASVPVPHLIGSFGRDCGGRRVPCRLRPSRYWAAGVSHPESLAAVAETALANRSCLAALLPPLAAILAWPVLYFVSSCQACFSCHWSWGVHGWAWLAVAVSANLAVLVGWPRVYILRGIVFVLQVLAILASWPVFLCLFHLLESMGL